MGIQWLLTGTMAPNGKASRQHADGLCFMTAPCMIGRSILNVEVISTRSLQCLACDCIPSKVGRWPGCACATNFTQHILIFHSLHDAAHKVELPFWLQESDR